MALQAEEEEDDYHFYGTPLGDEGDKTASKIGKGPTDLALVRNKAVHEQEPTDEQGRKRFHGAFTGGFSAGYFNTVGSKEGWQPSTFRSSRSDRAQAKQQSIDDYLDEDERRERGRSTLQVKPEYDTFGAGAAELARSIAQREADARPSLIPGAIFNELTIPVSASIGVRLLQKMGWRPGRGVGSAAPSKAVPSARQGSAATAGSRSRWGTVAGVSLENTPIYVLEPKQDQHGLGYDPFAGAEEFRASKRARTEAKQQQLREAAAAATGKLGMGGGGVGGGPAGGGRKGRGIAFGGVAEDEGMYGYMEDYVEEEGPRPGREALLTGRLGGFNYELGDSDEDEDMLPGRRKRPLLLEPGESSGAPLMLQSKEQLKRGGDFIPGFKKSDQQVVITLYPPPEVPPSFNERHVFPPRVLPLQQAAAEVLSQPPPPEVPPPSDPQLRREIDSLAAFVARSGPTVEALARRQARQALAAASAVFSSSSSRDETAQQGTEGLPAHEDGVKDGAIKFRFLLEGGEGAQYYAYRLYCIRRALALVQQGGGAAPGAVVHLGTGQGGGSGGGGGGQGPRRPPLTVEERMALLGEAALPSTAAARQALDSALGLAAGQQQQQPGQQAAGGAAGGTGAPQNQQVPAKGVAEGDKARLQEAMAGMFVKGETQDMNNTQQTEVGLRTRAGLGAPSSLAGAAAAALSAFGSRFMSGTTTETAALAPQAGGLQSRAAIVAAQKEDKPKPVRWFEDWRPEPLVCKRFNVPDPYKGKPKETQMSKFKTDYLALPETSLGLHTLQPGPRGGAEADLAQGSGAPTPPLPGPPPLGLPPPPAPASGAPAAAAAGGALPPPPPLPIDMASAVARAAAIASRLTGPQAATAQQAPPAAPPSSQPADAKAYAEQFLSSLSTGLFGGEGQEQGGSAGQAATGPVSGGTTASNTNYDTPTAAAPDGALAAPVAASTDGVAASVVAAAEAPLGDDLDRPLDIFKAIFEDNDLLLDEDEGKQQEQQQQQQPQDENEQQVNGSAAGHQQQQQPEPGGPPPSAPAGTAQQVSLAAALLKAQELSAARAAEARAQKEQQELTRQPLVGPQPAAGAGDAGGQQGAVDAAVQGRIRAALALLKKEKGSGSSKRDKKGKKDRKEKKDKKKHKKSSKSKSSKKTSKLRKDKQERKHASKSKRRKGSADASGTSSSSEDGERSDDSDSSSGSESD